MTFQPIFRSFNLWWDRPLNELDQLPVFRNLPSFKRPVYEEIRSGWRSLPQILSISGPRRVGKSTLMYQMIWDLIQEGTDPKRILYYSFDDPVLASERVDAVDLIESTMLHCLENSGGEPFFIFWDEIHKLQHWELFLKKFYDLKYPVRWVVSGSASTPIFKKSRESLLGRIKDYHLLPFSFSEFALYHFRQQGLDALSGEATDLAHWGGRAKDALFQPPSISTSSGAMPQSPSELLRQALDKLMDRYFVEGGFPETWGMDDWKQKQEYLFENQIQRVIYDDLIPAISLRKPENLKRFFLHLLDKPGRECTRDGLASEMKMTANYVDKFIKLLELTDLVFEVPKFRAQAMRVRLSNRKFYLVDLALRNSVLRVTDQLLSDNLTLGSYAENLVYLALKRWKGAVQIDYYRDKDAEVDFIAHLGPKILVPIEVKYQAHLTRHDLIGLKKFSSAYESRIKFSMAVIRNWDELNLDDPIWRIPLPLFLLLFD